MLLELLKSASQINTKIFQIYENQKQEDQKFIV